MLESVEWGEFRVGDLFKIDTGSLLSSSELIKGKVPRISAKSDDNGVLGFFDTKDNSNARHFENFISVNFFGTEGGIFYHPYKASVEMKVHVLKIPNIKLNSKTGNFIAAALKPIFTGFSYGLQLSSSKLKKENFRVKLPIVNGHLHLDFIENFVAELEAQRSAELEAYLSAAGLKDYAVSAEEERALAEFPQVNWAKFNLQKLFGKATRGKRLKSADRVSGGLPFVTAGEADTGISAFIGNQVERFQANTVTIDMFGSTKYRNYEYGADDHVAVVHTEEWGKMAVLFATAAMHKAAYTGEFNYGRNFYAKDADALNIWLPEKGGKPDYTYMQTLLSAVQKRVIKSVVQYADQKIAATNSVIHKG